MKILHRLALALGVAGNVAAPLLAQDDRETVRVARLVRDLGAESYIAREAAMRSLAQLGGASRQQLELAAQSADLEVRQRAGELLRRLKTEQLWRGATVALGDQPRLLSQALPEIARQTNNHVSTGTRFELFNDAPATLGVASGGYWQSLDELCRLTGNSLRPHYDARQPGVVLVTGKAGQNPLAYSGPFRLELVSARRVLDDELTYRDLTLKRAHSFKLVFHVLWEDRLQLTAYRAAPQVLAARPDAGEPLLPVETPRDWQIVGAGAKQVTLEVKLQPPGDPARSLETLLLEWELMAAGDPAQLLIDDLNSGAAARADGMEVVVEECQPKSDTLVDLCLAVSYDELLPEPPEAVFHENRYELLDAAGRPLELVDEAYELAAEAIGARLTFRRVAEGSAGQPARLRVTYPRLRSQRALTAQFNNIPLPTEAFRRAD